MNNNKIKNRDLISRFSSSLLGRGKKAEGYKTFFNLLLFLKINTERELLNLNLLKNNTNFVYFLHSIGFHEKALQKLFPKNEKALQNIAKVSSQSSLSLSSFLDNDSYQKSTLQLSNKTSINEQYASDSSTVLQSKALYDNFSLQAFPSKLLCKISIDNVKPILETRKVRKGRMTYRIPLVTRTERQEGKAISWLIEGANSRKNKVKNGVTSEKSISLNLKSVEERSTIVKARKKNYRSLQYCLADSILEAFQEKGESVEKRKEYHQLALQNRAYTHYRWW